MMGSANSRRKENVPLQLHLQLPLWKTKGIKFDLLLHKIVEPRSSCVLSKYLVGKMLVNSPYIIYKQYKTNSIQSDDSKILECGHGNAFFGRQTLALSQKLYKTCCKQAINFRFVLVIHIPYFFTRGVVSKH